MRAPRPSQARIDVEYVRSLEAVPRSEWVGLAAETGSIFTTPEWLCTWWRWFGRGRKPLIGLVSRDSELVAILPMYIWWTRGVPIVRFIGHGVSDRLGPISSPLTEPITGEVFARVIDAVPLRRFILLAELVPGGYRFGEVLGARTLYRDASPFLKLDEASWDAFLQSRSANFRQQVRRFARRLAELGAVSYRLTSDLNTLDQDLDMLFDLHRRRWNGATTPFVRAAGAHREIATSAIQRGWLRLWFLELDGKPVAAYYGFRFGGIEMAYQGGRDPTVAKLPLGSILLSHAVREALTDGIREYHFLRGGEDYKTRFANTDLGLETSGFARGADARLMLAAADAARGHSIGIRRRVIDRL
jgi:CelD/BcsL family acetyltransferase involved in cellulose biosynthesis